MNILRLRVPRDRRRETGQSLVELALAIPVLLILTFGIVDFGMALQRYITVTNAAREGARFGIVCNTDSAIQQRVSDYSDDLINPADVTVNWKDASTNSEVAPCSSTNYLEVTATYDYNFITPLGSFVGELTGGPLKLSSTTRMRVE